MANLVSAVMAWCPDCHAWGGVYQGPGETCEFECETKRWKTEAEGYGRAPRKLIRRRFYFCPEGPGDKDGIGNVGFFARKDALDHPDHGCEEFDGL